MTTFDALVVGAGYVGCAIAYHLAASGLRTILVDRRGIGGGASSANYGNIQVQDAELDHSLPLVTAGWRRTAELEKELDYPIGYRRLGGLLLVETEAQWSLIAARLPALHAAGIAAEMVPPSMLPEIEPLLAHGVVQGACFHADEGQVYPFALLRAYLLRGMERGLVSHLGIAVTGFRRTGGRITAVETTDGPISAGVIVLATGAWTTQLGRMLGRQWGIRHVRGQAVATERSSLRLQCHLASTAFFEDLHQEKGDGAVEGAVLAISQSPHGNFLLGEAAVVTDALDSVASPRGQADIAAMTARAFPALRGLRVLRGWAAPVAFTDDGLPFFGPVEGVDNLILATAFKSTVVVTPIVGELVAQLVLAGTTELDLSPFAPEREVGHAH